MFKTRQQRRLGIYWMLLQATNEEQHIYDPSEEQLTGDKKIQIKGVVHKLKVALNKF
jgi:hypothetical protein